MEARVWMQWQSTPANVHLVIGACVVRWTRTSVPHSHAQMVAHARTMWVAIFALAPVAFLELHAILLWMHVHHHRVLVLALHVHPRQATRFRAFARSACLAPCVKPMHAHHRPVPTVAPVAKVRPQRPLRLIR